MAKKQDNQDARRPTDAQVLGPETQGERWLKYGTNVVLAMVLVVAIGAAVVYLATQNKSRIDMTSSGMYSLKPQTVNIIKELDQPVEIVSLYSTAVRQDEMVRRTTTQDERRDYEQEVEARADRVRDLLEEYASKGRNITVQTIDPLRQEAKVNELVQRVATKYGGEVTKYREYIEQYRAFGKQVADLSAQQAVRTQGLPLEQLQQAPDQASQRAVLAVEFMRGANRMFDASEQVIEARLAESPPDYRGATNEASRTLNDFEQSAASFDQIAAAVGKQPAVPEPVRAYLAEAAAALKPLRERATQLGDEAGQLGELKLDEFRNSLSRRNTILVLGQEDLRVLDPDTIWQTDARDLVRDGAQLRPRFAGEQQVTSAILSLTRKTKPKVAFVRNGGAPLTDPGFPPFQPAGALSTFAQRLREFNFEVLEKDLSNMWAMQAQMRGQPAPPEPSDEQLRDAIWVVVNSANNMGGMGPATISPQVMEHVNNGGSAMILFAPQSANMDEILNDWGVRVRTDAVVFHPPVKLMGTPTDVAEIIKAGIAGFVTSDYAEHPITRPLQSLDTLMYALVPLMPKEGGQAGVKVTPLITLPETPQAWGETQLETDEDPKFDPMTDVPSPFYGAVAMEKENGPRLVVVPSIHMAADLVLAVPDTSLREQGVRASRFPGNLDLMLNSVFWLSKMETMMAISPTAMDVSRISGLTEPKRRAWGAGIFVVLPLAVVAAGVMVYFARRD